MNNVVLEELEHLGVIKQATSTKHGGQQTVVSSNADILKVTVAQVDVSDPKVLIIHGRRKHGGP